MENEINPVQKEYTKFTTKHDTGIINVSDIQT